MFVSTCDVLGSITSSKKQEDGRRGGKTDGRV